MLHMNSVGSRWPLLVYAFIVWTVFGSENTFPAIELSIGKRAPVVVAPAPTATSVDSAAPSFRESAGPAAPPASATPVKAPAAAVPTETAQSASRAEVTGAPAAAVDAAPSMRQPSEPRDVEALRELEESLLRDARGTSKAAVLPRPTTPSPKACQPRTAESWVSRDWTRGFANGWPSGMQYPRLPVSDDPRLTRYIGYFTGSPEGRKTFTTWLRRSGKYSEVFAGILQRRQLPVDIIAVAFVESGLWPTAVSKAGATGLWQFMPETARAYGLLVHDAFDERRSIWRSTEAAADHLRDLFEQVGSWELALAAYNMGYPRLSRAMEEAGTSDFWALSSSSGRLPRETALYVPKVLAVSVILNNLSYFGFDEVEPLPPLDAKPIQVPPAVALTDIARAAGTTVQQLRELNPQLTGESTPELAGAIDVYIPRGTAEARSRDLEWPVSPTNERRGAMPAEPAPVRIGPASSWLGRLPATAFQTPTSADLLRGLPTPRKLAAAVPNTGGGEAAEPESLLAEAGAVSWNSWVRGSTASAAQAAWRIVDGKLLLETGASANNAVPSADETPDVIKYRVLVGDTLWSIARAHRTSERRIARDNRISETSILSEGRLLTVRSPKQLL